MSFAIKKILKKLTFFFFGIAGFFLAFFLKSFFGEAHVNLEKLNDRLNKQLGKTTLFNVAQADTPFEGSSSEGSSGEGSSSEGGSTEGGCGSSSSEGGGDGW